MNVIKPYFTGIEKKIIEHINESKQSIKIAMAWFTNPEIKNCLIQKKESNPNIEISIVVGNNEINDKYFFNSEDQMRNVGIQIKEVVSGLYLHHKFIVLDETTTITGSYNYSKKANENLENIIVVECSKTSSYYSRIFDFLTVKNYIDENVKLLFEMPEFAKNLLSSYYPFNESEHLKYKSKIEIGNCFTYFNGLYDQIEYSPGLIFNPILLTKNYLDPDNFEFDIPIKKKTVESYILNRNEDSILDAFQGEEDLYHLINEELENNEKAVESYFKRKMKNTYNYSKLKDLIDGGINIIIEDELWTNNFEPFLNKELAEKLFEILPSIE